MNKSIQRGQSLFELVLSIGVIAIIIVALVSLVNNAVQNSTFSKNKSLATRLAEDGTEWLRSQRDKDIADFLTKTSTLPYSWCLKDAPLTDTSWNQHSACGTTTVSGTIFVREVTFATSLVSGKTLVVSNVKVSWQDSKGQHETLSSTQFADWRQR